MQFTIQRDGHYVPIQEDVRHDPWLVLVTCLLLNTSNRVQARRVLPQLVERWPGPEEIALADHEALAAVLRPSGAQHQKARRLKAMAVAFLGEWDRVEDLPGCGPYARDAVEIFVFGRLLEDPADHVLKDYCDWRRRLLTGLASSARLEE